MHGKISNDLEEQTGCGLISITGPRLGHGDGELAGEIPGLIITLIAVAASCFLP